MTETDAAASARSGAHDFAMASTDEQHQVEGDNTTGTQPEAEPAPTDTGSTTPTGLVQASPTTAQSQPLPQPPAQQGNTPEGDPTSGDPQPAHPPRRATSAPADTRLPLRRTTDTATQTTGADDIHTMSRLLGQGPTAVSAGLHNLSPTAEHIVRATAAILHETTMRTAATGTTEHPRRLQPAPAKPPAPQQPAQPLPKPAPTQQAADAQRAGFNSATDQAKARRLGFTDPQQWHRFLEQNPTAAEVTYTLAASPLETNRPAAPAKARPIEPQPKPTSSRPPPEDQPTSNTPAGQPKPTPVKARPSTSPTTPTQATHQPTSSGDVSTAQQAAAPAATPGTSGVPRPQTTNKQEPSPASRRLGAEGQAPAKAAPPKATTNPPTTGNQQWPQPDTQAPPTNRPPTSTWGRRDDNAYHPWGPPRAVYAQPPAPADPEAPPDTVTPAETRLSYEQDRALRHRLQRTGAYIPDEQLPRPPIDQLAVAGVEDLEWLEDSATGQPVPWLQQVGVLVRHRPTNRRDSTTGPAAAGPTPHGGVVWPPMLQPAMLTAMLPTSVRPRQ